MNDKLRELAERWKTVPNVYGSAEETYRECAYGLIAILDAEGDAGAAGGALWIGRYIPAEYPGGDDERQTDYAHGWNACRSDVFRRVFGDYTHPQPVRSGVVSDGARERFESAMRKTWSDFNSARHPHSPDEYLKASEQCAWQGYQAHAKEEFSEPSPIYECKHCKLPNHAGMDHADCEDAANSRAMIAAINQGQSND